MNPSPGTSNEPWTRRGWDAPEVLGFLAWAGAGFLQQGLVAGWLKSTGFPAWIALVCGQSVFLLFVLLGFVRLTHAHGLRTADALGCRNPLWPRHVGAGLLAGLAFLPAAYGLQALVSGVLRALGYKVPIQNAVELLLAAGPAGRAGIYVAAGIGAPVAEEILFRGVIFATVRDSGWPRLALAGSALLFGAVHFNLGSLVPLTGFGMLLALVYDRTGSLLAPIAAHMVFNAAPFVMLLLGVEFAK
jgi:membrane protease YdiL (CAAX protease family)